MVLRNEETVWSHTKTLCACSQCFSFSYYESLVLQDTYIDIYYRLAPQVRLIVTTVLHVGSTCLLFAHSQNSIRPTKAGEPDVVRTRGKKEYHQVVSDDPPIVPKHSLSIKRYLLFCTEGLQLMYTRGLTSPDYQGRNGPCLLSVASVCRTKLL